MATANGKIDSQAVEDDEVHKNAKMVTLFSIEAEMAEADNDSRHFMNISDVEEEKQSRNLTKKGNKQRLA